MKKYLLPLVVLATLFITSCEEKIDILKEEEAIKAVIEGEINASFNGDYETWTTFFAQEPYTFWLQANREGYVNCKGWEEINSHMKQTLKPDRKGSIIYEGNSDYIIRVYKVAALATFKAKMTAVQENKTYEGLEVRTLEKKDGEWKITYLGTVYSSTYEEQEMESEEPEEEGPETEDTE